MAPYEADRRLVGELVRGTDAVDLLVAAIRQEVPIGRAVYARVIRGVRGTVDLVVRSRNSESTVHIMGAQTVRVAVTGLPGRVGERIHRADLDASERGAAEL